MPFPARISSSIISRKNLNFWILPAHSETSNFPGGRRNQDAARKRFADRVLRATYGPLMASKNCWMATKAAAPAITALMYFPMLCSFLPAPWQSATV